MRYKLIGLVMILLISTPVFSQEPSPLIVETIKNTTPTVVKTGEHFTQSYRIEYIDLSDSGDEIIIDEGALNTGMLDKFEILNFKIDKSTQRRNFLVHVWDLQYTLRIIDKEKGHYKISPITILWRRKKIGQKADEAKVNTNIRTDEVYVDYVSTITQDPELSPREKPSLDNFKVRAWILWGTSWFLAIAPLGLWVFIVTRYFRSAGNYTAEDLSAIESEADMSAVGVVPLISKKKALRNLYKNIRELEKSKRNVGEILASLKDFLRAEVPRLGIGATPLDMRAHIEKNLPDNKYKKALLSLALEAVAYQATLEGKSTQEESYPPTEARKLRAALGQTKWHAKLIENASSIFSKK